MSFVNICRLRRDILKMSRLDFSIKTGFSEHTLRRIEGNENKLTNKTKKKL